MFFTAYQPYNVHLNACNMFGHQDSFSDNYLLIKSYSLSHTGGNKFEGKRE